MQIASSGDKEGGLWGFYKVVSNIMLRLLYDHYVLIVFIIKKVMVTLVYFPLRTILNGKMEGLSRNPIRSQLKSEL